MPRPKKTTPESRPAEPRPSGTSRLFSPRKSKDKPALTHERIAEDLETFRKSGGTIEVLGTTRTLSKIDPDDDSSPPPRPANAPRSNPHR